MLELIRKHVASLGITLCEYVMDGRAVMSFYGSLPEWIIDGLRLQGKSVQYYSRYKHGVCIVEETIITF
jgi:hypothetical protein